LEPSFLKPNYDTFSICDQELGCEGDHDHLMMLNDQIIFQIPNTTILENNKQTQPQDHGSPQAFHPCAYNVKVDYEKKKVDFDLFNPLYDEVLYDAVNNEWLKLVYEDPLDSIDTCDESSFEDPHEVD
jgi:hypothetical protein